MNHNPPPREPRPSAGFTLIEIMVVVAILGMLAAVVAINVFDTAERAKERIAKTQCRSIASAVRLYLTERGRLPRLTDLVTPDEQDNTYLEELPLDPWEREYELVPGDPAKRFTVISLGFDGVADTEDDVRSRGR